MTLKAKNSPIIVGFTLLLYVGFAAANGLDWGWAQKVQISGAGLVFENPLISIGAHMIVLILSFLIPSELKHRIVYLRWANPLPGSRVFTAVAGRRDARISSARLLTENCCKTGSRSEVKWSRSLTVTSRALKPASIFSRISTAPGSVAIRRRSRLR